MVYHEVETAVELGQSDQQAKERVTKVDRLKRCTEVINALSETKHYK